MGCIREKNCLNGKPIRIQTLAYVFITKVYKVKKIIHPFLTEVLGICKVYFAFTSSVTANKLSKVSIFLKLITYQSFLQSFSNTNLNITFGYWDQYLHWDDS